MESCGYRCLRQLYAMQNKEHLLNHEKLEVYRMMSALSIIDLIDIIHFTGLVGKAYYIEDFNITSYQRMLPFIAHLSFFHFNHYIVVLKAGWWIVYLEPGYVKRRFLPKFLFHLVFTKKIIKIDCF